MTKKNTFPWGTGLAATGTGGVGWLLAQTPWETSRNIGYALEAGAVSAVGVRGWFYVRYLNSTMARLARARKRALRTNGTGTRLQHWQSAGRHAMRRKAAAILPETTAGLGPIARRRIPLNQYAMYQGTESRLGRIYTSREEVTVILGGPRRGKSAMMGTYILDAPGACVVTSTRADLAELTMRHREQVGPVHVFDPSGASGMANTFKWTVLSGCKHPPTARRRATDMIPTGATAEHEKWNGLARQTLAVLMHAAALRGDSMFKVLSWAARPDANHRREVEGALTTGGDGEHVEAWLEMSNQFFGNNDRTQTSITTTLTSYLSWLLVPKAGIMGAAVDELEEPFSIRQLVDTKGTVYMIGDKDDGVAPLVAALVGEIGHQSRILAMARGGRLEPPLTLVLDEAANICPIPLHRWTSFMGGHNITLTASFQDPTQIASIWGADAQSIRDHAACLVVFGGIEDSRFLEECVRKCDIIEDPTNGGVQQRVTTITPAEIMSLPAHRALVFRTGMSHVIVTAPNIYKRREFRRRSRAIAVPLDVTETRYAEKLADAPTGE